MRRLTTDEVIQLGINRATLIDYVRNELVVAYDDKNKPIDLKEKERKFLDIQRLCEPETHTEQQTRPKRTPNPFTGGRQLFGSETGKEKSFAVEKKYRRIFVIPDQYPTQAGMIANVWIDWDILHSTLSDRDIKDLPINIAFSQEQAILKGWNNDRIFDFIKEATFSEADIKEIAGPDTEQPPTALASSVAHDADLYPKNQKREKLPNWNEIESVTHMSRKTILTAQKELKGKAVVHQEGNNVWAWKDEALDLSIRWRKHKERKAAEKRSANRKAKEVVEQEAKIDNHPE